MWWFVAAAILFLAWFAWQLLGPNPPIIVSKETTYITAPLCPVDGRPDFTKYLLTTLRAGVTPENNAAVPLWQKAGLGEGPDAISVDDWQLLDRELSLGPPPTADCVLAPIHSKDNRAQVLAWINARAAHWRRAPKVDSALLAELAWTQEDVDADEVIALAMESPWRHDDLPPLAEWVARNRAVLDSLVAALQRPRFYSPAPGILRDDNESRIGTSALPDIVRLREVARALKLRAMLRLGEGSPTEAWQDLLAIYRWARLVAQGAFTIDQLIAVAIDGIACSGTTALLGSENLSPSLARTIQSELAALSPSSCMADVVDSGERLYYLDTTLAGSRKGMGSFLAIDLGSSDKKPSSFQPLNFVRANWNVALADGNRWCDRLAAACRLTTHSERMLELERLSKDIHSREALLRNPLAWVSGAFNITRRSEMLATRILASLTPTFPGNLIAQDSAVTRLQLVGLAAALAVYRADHGHYPDRLIQLVPDIIPQLPVDLYHAKPFIYRPEADGYLVYSLGPNGIDDGGSNEQREILAGREIGWDEDDATEKLRQQIPAGADDIAIRVPRPPFKLPEPPAP